MKYGMPLGGEDLAAIAGDLHLGLAKGGESFFPLGAEADAPALAGELIYYDEQGAICRCLNWREAQRTMLKKRPSTQYCSLNQSMKNNIYRLMPQWLS